MFPLVHHRHYHTELPSAHRFPMGKFRRLYELLVADGIASAKDFQEPELPPLEFLETVHTPEYVGEFLAGRLDAKAMRRIGLPWSEELALRSRIAVGGTLLTARLALEYGLACNTAGGTHHAFPAYGSGFCIFNDLAAAAGVLRAERPQLKVMIIDLDVHQGDGTAHIFRNEAMVFTYSMHCEKNFPGQKERSDLDVGLDEGTGDDVYLERLSETLLPALADFAPDLVLYDAGADPHAEDILGKLALSDAGLRRRDTLILESVRGRNIPCACVIGGGYSKDLDALARRHSILHRTARDFL